jgi:hypothetical protein
MSQQLSREQIREIVARAVAQFEGRLAAAGVTASRTQPAEQAQTAPAMPPAYFAPWTGAVYHPSGQQFNLAGDPASAAPDVLQFSPGAPCTIEKGKPCDQCGACRVLGF